MFAQLTFLALLLLFAVGAVAVPAQPADQFLSAHKQRRAKNPEELSFTVRLKDNRKQFHLGEIITLELSFAASKPDMFTLDAATYDRSGRLNSDGFALDPRDGAVDPIADYFDFNNGLMLAGGLRSIPDLTDKPYVITTEMNEWQRIDKPGHYRLYVVSSRVGRKASGKRVYLENGSSAVVSDVIEFDVLPADKKWAGEKLNEAIAGLSKPAGSHESACRTLRFLGTTAAATEMRKRFSGDDNECEWDYKFGLIGSPHRDFVIRDMENAISAREQAVTSHYVRTLALLEFIKREPEAPPFPANESEEQISQWRLQMNQRENRYNELCLNYVRQLVMAIPSKQGQARAVSLQTLLDYRLELSKSGSSEWTSLLSLVPEVFNRLTLRNQLWILKDQWTPIASAAMLPVLREVLKYTYSSQQEMSFNAFEQQDMRGIAMTRIYELSPEEGRRLIVEEIRNPKPRVPQDTLRSLPEETLPELNTVLAGNLEESRRKDNGYADDISELIERYATAEILSRVRAIYESKTPLECRTEAALLAYFLRVDPALGSEYLNKALRARPGRFPRCYETVLKSVADLRRSKEVEDIAIAALDDEDSDSVSQAASVLAEYGSADTEKALWRRFEKWHEAMQSRNEEEELSFAQEKIEKALREALTNGQAWLLDPEKLKRVRDLCVTNKGREEVERLISNWEPGIYVNTSFFDSLPRFGVANREVKSLDLLKDKLLQFPKGTLFKLRIAPRGDDTMDQELLKQIEIFLEEHGMKWKPEP